MKIAELVKSFPTFHGRPSPYSRQPATPRPSNNQLIYCLLTARHFSCPRLLYRNIPCYPPHLKAGSPSRKPRTHHSLVARNRINIVPSSGPPFLTPKFTQKLFVTTSKTIEHSNAHGIISGVLEKAVFRNSPLRFNMSTRTYQSHDCQMGFNKIRQWTVLLKFIDALQFCLQLDNSNEHFTVCSTSIPAIFYECCSLFSRSYFQKRRMLQKMTERKTEHTFHTQKHLSV
jgi:hypothetical protein